MTGDTVTRMRLELKSWEESEGGLVSNFSQTPPIIRDIGDRLRQLEYLCVEYLGMNLPNYDVELQGLLQSLSSLREVRLPCLCLDASFAQIISRHRHLRTISIEFKYCPYTCVEATRTLYRSDTPLHRGAFPSLHELSCTARDLPDLSSFLTQPAFPLCNLVTLWCHTRAMPSHEALMGLLESLTSNCHSLNTLALSFNQLAYHDENELQSIPHIHLQHLVPISRLSHLQWFEFRHPYPLEGTDDDVRQLTSRCPRIKGLLLNPNPLLLKSTSLTLIALKVLVLQCPQMQKIGLYIDARVVPVATPLFIARMPGHTGRGNTIRTTRPGHGLSPSAFRPASTAPITLTLDSSIIPVIEDGCYDDYSSIAKYVTGLPFSSEIFLWDRSYDKIRVHLGSDPYEDDKDSRERGWETIASIANLIMETKIRTREELLALLFDAPP